MCGSGEQSAGALYADGAGGAVVRCHNAAAARNIGHGDVHTDGNGREREHGVGDVHGDRGGEPAAGVCRYGGSYAVSVEPGSQAAVTGADEPGQPGSDVRGGAGAAYEPPMKDGRA